MQRLARKKELDTVRQQGKRFRTAHLEVRYVASLLRHARAGIIVPRYSQSAVDRNRVKRRLRELVRLNMLPLLRGVDVVVRALPSAYGATFAELRTQCDRASEQITGVARL